MKFIDESKQWDVNHLQKQIDACESSIKNGDWIGYSENLAIRKKRLKEMKRELEILKGDENKVV
jgi:hypothetical protein